jgi:Rod binding domain-containing protein
MTDGLSLPPVDATVLPADVRKAGPKAEQSYRAALAFENVLIDQLTQSLGSTLEGDGGADDDGSADAASSLTAQLIPDALAQSLTASGGLGLARQLYGSFGGASTAASHDDRSTT